MRTAITAIGWAILAVASVGCAGNSVTLVVEEVPPRLDAQKIVDLSYPFGPETIYWPTAEPFKLQRVAYGRTPKGYWYAANNLSMAEHGGTHMDAPIHFAEGHRSSAEVSLADCMGPAVVIDVSEAAERDVDYRMTVADVGAFEKKHGRIPPGAVVVLHSGWGKRWPDRKRFLGTDVPMDVKNLHFPGYSREAAELLVRERNVTALATDTASIDYGQSEDFIVHQVLSGADKPGFENVANTDRLPPTGAWFMAFPLKIENGTGGPARIVGVLP